MRVDLSPLRLLLVTLAGWINRHQQQVIEYLVEENRVLKEQLKGRRLRLTDDQRRRGRRGNAGLCRSPLVSMVQAADLRTAVRASQIPRPFTRCRSDAP
jgi:hypothetical protein